MTPTLVQLFIAGIPATFCPSGGPADGHIHAFGTPWKSEVKLWAPYTVSPNTRGSSAALWFCCGQAYFHFHVVEGNVASGFQPGNPASRCSMLHPKDTAHTRTIPLCGIDREFIPRDLGEQGYKCTEVMRCLVEWWLWREKGAVKGGRVGVGREIGQARVSCAGESCLLGMK